MNILGSLFKAADQPAVLPHLGEAYGAWFYHVICSSALSFCQLAVNHVHDPDLGSFIADLSHQLEKPHLEKVRAFLHREGVPFPLDLPRHPKADPQAIPPGARMEDIEIANLQAIKLESLMTTCCVNMQQSLREDIGAMYMGFQGDLIAYSLRLKKLMQERGWMIMPPLYGPASVGH